MAQAFGGTGGEKLRQSEERLERAEAELETLAQRNAILQSQLQESAQRLAREEARRVASLQEQAQLHDLSTWETRVRELEQTLATREMATREQERMHKSNIRLLTRKLREKMKELKLAQVQLANAANAESQQQDDQLQRQGQKPVNQEVQTLEQPQKASAEAQTDAAAKIQEEQTELAEKNQELLLQLEREQGRLAGSLKAQEELRACVEQLERQLSEQGGRMAELQCQLEQVQGRADQAQALHQTSVADLQRELEKERTLSKELRQRIFEEKRRGGQLQRQLSSLKQGLSEASQSADAGRLKAQAQAERAQSLETQLREAQGRLEALRGDLAASQAARQELEAKLRNAHERDPALEQQMKLLSWNVKEKTQEVAALQERVRLAETAHQAEVSALRRQLEEAQQQHSNLSAELMSVRKEKFTFQARLQELKNVLRSRMEQCKELQRQLTELAETTEFALPNVAPDYDDSYITELLQQCSSQPTSRPLGSLQVCLDSLKQDLNTLHSQIRQNVELPKKELVT
ncbi:ciliary rootlet coiled-coil protein 2 [Dermacentor silvarum]|uniref:ciliary rootlet coiled-coil protein 2 n=1 Tax=Dermacentor silvarum TaxID=543639 RepID=UPI0018997D32|nr:ciliary rootlet coiled-coil protein 2 [Dermacentor silvarum]